MQAMVAKYHKFPGFLYNLQVPLMKVIVPFLKFTSSLFGEVHLRLQHLTPISNAPEIAGNDLFILHEARRHFQTINL